MEWTPPLKSTTEEPVTEHTGMHLLKRKGKLFGLDMPSYSSILIQVSLDEEKSVLWWRAAMFLNKRDTWETCYDHSWLCWWGVVTEWSEINEQRSNFDRMVWSAFKEELKLDPKYLYMLLQSSPFRHSLTYVDCPDTASQVRLKQVPFTGPVKP